MTGMLFDIQRFSVHDGPGIRTTVFLKGCPLRCAWCQNPEGLESEPQLWNFDNLCVCCGACVNVCATQALSLDGAAGLRIDHALCVGCGSCVERCYRNALALDGYALDSAALVAQLLTDRVFFSSSGGGVTFSGGEPLAQAAFVTEVAKQLQKENIHTAVETSLMGGWDDLVAWLKCIEYFHVDLKVFSPSQHQQSIGADNAVIMANFSRLIAEIGNNSDRVKVRIPLVPGHTDAAENLQALGAYVDGVGQGGLVVELMNFNPLAQAKYRRMGMDFLFFAAPAYSDAQLEYFKTVLLGSMSLTSPEQVLVS